MNKTSYLVFISLILSCTPPKSTSEHPSPGNSTARSEKELSTSDQTGKTSQIDGEIAIPGKGEMMKANEYDMLAEINLMRSNPGAYVVKVESYLSDVQNDPTWDNAYIKAELEAGMELIEELKTTPERSQLKENAGLYQAAIQHGKDLQKQNRITHQGSDGSQPFDRIKEQAPTMLDGAENLVSGATNYLDGLMVLLVDSNVPGKGHRKNLLNPKWESAACYEAGAVDGLSGSWIQLFGTESDRADALATAPTVEEGPADYSFMTADEKAMLEEINLMRANPKGYIPYVEAYVKEFSEAGWDSATTEEEGQTSKELIGQLRKLEALSVLRPHQELYEVARLHGADLRQMGSIQHQGSDGSMPYNRVRQGTDLSDGNENIVGGTTYIRESVITLLVDSGIPNRGHRKALLEPKWNYVACYRIGQVGQMPNTWLQVFGAR